MKTRVPARRLRTHNRGSKSDSPCKPGRGRAEFRPTSHLPGTAGKVAVMCLRCAAGYPVHHPEDAQYTGRKAAVIQYAGANFKQSGLVAGDEVELRGQLEPERHYPRGARRHAGEKRFARRELRPVQA